MKVVTGVKNLTVGIKDLEGRGGHLTEAEDMKMDKEGDMGP